MNNLYHGAAYYPELWDKETIQKDIELMKEAGINVVRIGEFAWSSLEPHQDDFHVDIFSDVIYLLNQNNIKTIMCTPTPTPPVWISYNHAERMITDVNQTKMIHGGRQQVCTNNEFFRNRATIITEKLAKKYGSMEGVIAWQIDNELKGNVSECYCETCKNLWHKWLKETFNNIKNLNDSWGTHIWSQYYESFSQVPQPFKTPMGHNPSLLTAYQKFSRDFAASFINEQADLIRKHSHLPITHNSSLNHFIDNQKVFDSLDFVSYDHYSESQEYYKYLSWIDTFKSLKNKPFWIMETSPSFSGSICSHQKMHPDNYVRAEAIAAYASGAEGFSYWLWRQHKNGAEQTHGHIISSWGDKSIGYLQAKKVSVERKKLQTVLSKTIPVPADLAMTYSDTARTYFITEPLEDNNFNYVEKMMLLYKEVLEAGIYRDLIFEDHSFNNYKILFTPYMPYISDSYFERAKDFVKKGGIWIIGPLSGYRTEHHGVNTNAALGDIEEFAGIRTKYLYPMSNSETYGLALGIKTKLSLLSSVYECIDSIAIGFTINGITPNMPFITECNRGEGKIVMLGSMPTDELGSSLVQKLLLHYSKTANIKKMYKISKGTIAIPRINKEYDQLVVINMDGKGGEINTDKKALDAFTNKEISKGSIPIEPYNYKVINFNK